MQKLWNLIKSVISLIEKESLPVTDNETRFIIFLDVIALSIQEVNPKLAYNGGKIPEFDYPSLQQLAREKLPNWGMYNYCNEVSKSIGNTTVSSGNAIDDVATIVYELKRVVWSLENESEGNALWLLLQGYKNHWRGQMLRLKLYVHSLDVEGQ